MSSDIILLRIALASKDKSSLRSVSKLLSVCEIASPRPPSQPAQQHHPHPPPTAKAASLPPPPRGDPPNTWKGTFYAS